jgi:hypothetical protein
MGGYLADGMSPSAKTARRVNDGVTNSFQRVHDVRSMKNSMQHSPWAKRVCLIESNFAIMQARQIMRVYSRVTKRPYRSTDALDKYIT